jgi:hypothetical protein
VSVNIKNNVLTNNIPYIIGAIFIVGLFAYISARKNDKGIIIQISGSYITFLNGKDMSLRCGVPVKELKISMQHCGDPKNTRENNYSGPAVKFENTGISDITIATTARTLTWKNPKNNNYFGLHNYHLDKMQWLNLINALGLTNELIVPQENSAENLAKKEAAKKRAIKFIIGWFIFFFLFFLITNLLRYYNIPFN